MRAVRLGRTFDAVLIHDAIAHMLTEDDLRATFETARVHLRPKGVLLVAPEWVQDTIQGPRVFRWTRKKGGPEESIEVSIKENLHDPDPSDTQIESVYTYTIKKAGSGREAGPGRAGPGRGLRVETDTHTTGLFPEGAWVRLMGEAGFLVEKLERPGNRGGYGGLMFLGVLQEA